MLVATRVFALGALAPTLSLRAAPAVRRASGVRAAFATEDAKAYYAIG